MNYQGTQLRYVPVVTMEKANLCARVCVYREWNSGVHCARLRCLAGRETRSTCTRNRGQRWQRWALALPLSRNRVSRILHDALYDPFQLPACNFADSRIKSYVERWKRDVARSTSLRKESVNRKWRSKTIFFEAINSKNLDRFWYLFLIVESLNCELDYILSYTQWIDRVVHDFLYTSQTRNSWKSVKVLSSSEKSILRAGNWFSLGKTIITILQDVRRSFQTSLESFSDRSVGDSIRFQNLGSEIIRNLLLSLLYNFSPVREKSYVFGRLSRGERY